MSETNLNEESSASETNLMPADEILSSSDEEVAHQTSESQGDVKGQQLENAILKWISKEKELVGLKENLSNNDFGDYSILMYETQDAFNHCRNLRLKLTISEEQLRIKTKQCGTLTEQKNHLTRRLQMIDKHYHERERLMQAKLKTCEQQLIGLYSENEFLQGKCDDMKDLCLKYQKRYFDDESTATSQEMKKRMLGIDSIFTAEIPSASQSGGLAKEESHEHAGKETPDLLTEKTITNDDDDIIDGQEGTSRKSLLLVSRMSK